MNELQELYQQIILDHNRNPKNFGPLDDATQQANGYNPLCGDKVKVYLMVKDGIVEDIRFEGSGCAISKASASVMTTVIKGKTVEEAKEMFESFQQMITSSPQEDVDLDAFGKLAVFAGVREFPSRVKCAGLPWHALTSALDGGEEVSTE